jgi:protein SCO1
MTVKSCFFSLFDDPLAALLLAVILGLTLCTPAGAHHEAQHQLPPLLRDVGFDQRLNTQIPFDLVFQDETGRMVRLGDFFDTRPVILTLAYYECPMLCGLGLDGLAQSLRALSFSVGEQFVVLTVSFDARDTSARAAAKKAQLLRSYARPGAAQGWHFLTGDEASIRQLTQTVGFRYVYDPEKDQFAHAAGIVVLTPQGTIARYLYGLEFEPKAVRLALLEAATGTIGSPIDRLLLFCYQYDPATGTYGVIIMNVLRLAGLITVVALGGFLALMFSRERLKIEARQ